MRSLAHGCYACYALPAQVVRPVADAGIEGAPERPRADDEAAARLRAAILGGTYAIGARLPGERELSVRLGVSRATLRSAITRLAGEGLLRAAQGSGTVVLDYRETGGIELLPHLAAAGAGVGGPLALLRDLLELRRTLAVDAIGFATERCSLDELVALRSHVAVQRRLLAEPARYVAGDLALARRMAAATHNTALVLVANTLVRLLERQHGLEPAFLAEAEATVAFYERVLELIARRDAPLARRYARVLLTRVDRQLLARLGAVSVDADGAAPDVSDTEVPP